MTDQILSKSKIAVVDERLRVRGVQGLRVADASVMPSIVRGSTNAIVMAIGEKAADMIREDWSKSPSKNRHQLWIDRFRDRRHSGSN